MLGHLLPVLLEKFEELPEVGLDIVWWTIPWVLDREGRADIPTKLQDENLSASGCMRCHNVGQPGGAWFWPTDQKGSVRVVLDERPSVVRNDQPSRLFHFSSPKCSFLGDSVFIVVLGHDVATTPKELASEISRPAANFDQTRMVVQEIRHLMGSERPMTDTIEHPPPIDDILLRSSREKDIYDQCLQ